LAGEPFWRQAAAVVELKMKLSDWLVAYLKKIAVSHLFGSPGDLVIKLFSGSIGRGRSMSSRFRTNQAWALPPMVTRGRPAASAPFA
jgi:hypothetical protein